MHLHPYRAPPGTATRQRRGGSFNRRKQHVIGVATWTRRPAGRRPPARHATTFASKTGQPQGNQEEDVFVATETESI
jgi:hypothetical protein